MNEQEQEFKAARAEIGPHDDLRMGMSLATHSPHEIDARNQDHLAAYARARRVHAASCTASRACTGWAVVDAIDSRMNLAGPSYLYVLVGSAIGRIDELTQQLEESRTELLRTNFTLAEERAEAVRLRAEVAEGEHRIQACEEAISDMRAGWPIDN